MRFLASAPSMTARTSSSRMMRYSSPSSLISWPEYLPNRMVSPALTSSGMRLPSSFTLPSPAAMTLPCCGFSLAVSGMMIPPTFCSPSSMRWTMMRSCSGLTFMLCAPSVVKCGCPCGLQPGDAAERRRALALALATANYMSADWQCQRATAKPVRSAGAACGLAAPIRRLILYSPIFRVSVLRWMPSASAVLRQAAVAAARARAR